MHGVPILAAFDLWEWLVPIVVIAVYVISHLWNSIQGPQPQHKRPNQQRRPRGPQGERPLPAAPGQQRPPEPVVQGELNAEIEQFLKRANERRAEKQRRAAERRQPQTPARPERRHVVETPIDAEPSDRHEYESVAASVQQHFGSRTFEEREEHLADDIARADQEMEQHVSDAFRHRLGSLQSDSLADEQASKSDDRKTTPDANRAAAARAVAGLLVNQQSLRQAVLLKEILERPVDRW